MRDTSPIQVYLDSSDYSALARRPHDPSAWAVAEYLEAKTAEGLVEVRFSAVHIMEMLALAREHIERADERFAVVQRLCGRRCLVPPSEVWDAELSQPEGVVSPGALRNDRGDWIGCLDELISTTTESLVGGLRAAMASHLGGGRQARRRVEKYFSADGRHLKPSATKMFAPMICRSLDELASQWPVRPESREVIKRQLFGRATNSEVSEALLGSFRDPAWIARWQSADFQRMESLGRFLRGVTGEMAGSFSGAVELFRSAALDSVTHKSELGRVGTAEWQREVVEDVVARAGGWQSVRPDFPAPGLRTTVRLAMAVGADALTTTSGRKVTPNDFADCFHAVYAPYVDVFRADRYMAAKLSALGVQGVVGRLRDVPAAVESLLSLRQASHRAALERLEPVADKASA